MIDRSLLGELRLKPNEASQLAAKQAIKMQRRIGHITAGENGSTTEGAKVSAFWYQFVLLCS
jgi:hypothetical protein